MKFSDEEEYRQDSHNMLEEDRRSEDELLLKRASKPHFSLNRIQRSEMKETRATATVCKMRRDCCWLN